MIVVKDFSVVKTAIAIIAMREEANLTQAQLAEKIQTSQQAISMYEMGKSYPGLQNFLKIVEACGMRLIIEKK